MKQISGLNTEIMFIDGTPTGANLKIIIANSIARASHVEAAVAMNVAMRIIESDDSIELDEHELNVILECINNDMQTSNFAKIKMIEALNKE